MSNKTPFTIAYDFDGTLSPGNMQEYDFIPALGIAPAKFWDEAKNLAKEQNGDEILAYMRLMIEKATEHKQTIRREDFQNFGKAIKFFNGVEDWFTRINSYGEAQGIDVRHYIISSGLREMIEGTSIADEFEKIYASGFMYDHNGLACWPALAVNYTTKTQFLFRINKGSFDVYDNSVINQFIPHNERPAPFSNMIFIGDGETDIPCMRLVKEQGGHSIAVYADNKDGARNKTQQLVKEGRADFSLMADYSENSQMDCAVKSIIDLIAARASLKQCAGNAFDEPNE